MDNHQSLGNKNGALREWRRRQCGWVHGKRPNFRGPLKSASIIYKNVILPLRITKMPLLGLKCWPIHSDDVEMTWK